MAIDEDEGVVFAVGDLIWGIQTACRNAELTDKWEMCMSSDYPKGSTDFARNSGDKGTTLKRTW